MTNEILPPEVPCGECMKFFTSGTKPSDFLAVYCCHRFCVALYNPRIERWEIRAPVNPGELGQWLEQSRTWLAPEFSAKKKRRRRYAISMAAALDRLEASTSGFPGVH